MARPIIKLPFPGFYDSWYSDAIDREGESFEQRVRGWLGEAQAEFDIGLAAHNQCPVLLHTLRPARPRRSQNGNQHQSCTQ